MGELICACTIAGSDPGGGAGVQADLKTFSAIGVWGLSVITALTAQNSREVRNTWVMAPQVVEDQIRAILDDFPVHAWKTGMLGNGSIITAVAGALPDETPLVVDPVMISTSGCPLLEEGAHDDLIRHLIPRATVVTPNLHEAAALSGMPPITNAKEMSEAGRRILDYGASSVLVKGGHLPGDRVFDILVMKDGETVLEGRRYPYQVHGSGCVLSAAITAYLARGYPVPRACHEARAVIDLALRDAVVSGSGARVANPGFSREWFNSQG